MPRVDFVTNCPLYDSFRVQQIVGMFGLEGTSSSEIRVSAELPSLEEEWNVGAIVGPSGAGKTTLARRAYAEYFHHPIAWPTDRAVIDGFPDFPIQKITQMLTAVGFGSPPHWLKPYSVLSGGEQFRCELAQALLKQKSLFVFDEFTSLLDRHSAQLLSAAVSKTIRRENRKFIAVTCHEDVLPWLEPDWVYRADSGQLQRRRLRRPSIHLDVGPCRQAFWKSFADYHYLSGTLSPYATCWLGSWEGRPVAFAAVLHAIGQRGLKRISRLVVHPLYQGLGIGSRFLQSIAGWYLCQGLRIRMSTSHPGMVHHLKHSVHWLVTDVQACRRNDPRSGRGTVQSMRPLVSAEFLG
ncbi:Cytochrome c biogenesis ATP-binding export protein CcmA [Planctomycetales bacterium 10988]|nr:Cytochrome c biogenesis ATP-binding export protein CcmA [Planctomycetales bacterium 10988]